MGEVFAHFSFLLYVYYIHKYSILKVKRQIANGVVIPHSALWLYSSETDNWRFLIASDIPDFSSPQKAYMYIDHVLQQMAEAGKKVGFSLENISVISPNNPLIKNLRLAMKTGSNNFSGIRFSRNRIGDSYIEDAYIYRIQ